MKKIFYIASMTPDIIFVDGVCRMINNIEDAYIEMKFEKVYGNYKKIYKVTGEFEFEEVK
jgi:hypothetical protein